MQSCPQATLGLLKTALEAVAVMTRQLLNSAVSAKHLRVCSGDVSHVPASTVATFSKWLAVRLENSRQLEVYHAITAFLRFRHQNFLMTC